MAASEDVLFILLFVVAFSRFDVVGAVFGHAVFQLIPSILKQSAMEKTAGRVELEFNIPLYSAVLRRLGTGLPILSRPASQEPGVLHWH